MEDNIKLPLIQNYIKHIKFVVLLNVKHYVNK